MCTNTFFIFKLVSYGIMRCVAKSGHSKDGTYNVSFVWFQHDINHVHTLMVICSFQLIYDVKDDGGSIGLLSTAPQKCLHLRDIGVDIPTMK